MSVADLVSFSRVLLSPTLLFLSPSSISFGIIYLICGISDVADGFIARKTHKESKSGAKLDSMADIVFLSVCAVKILPIVKISLWIWVWVAIITVVKIAAMIYRYIRNNTFVPPHSFANKLTGFLLYILPLAASVTDVTYFAVIVCTVATVAAILDFLK